MLSNVLNTLTSSTLCESIDNLEDTCGGSESVEDIEDTGGGSESIDDLENTDEVKVLRTLRTQVEEVKVLPMLRIQVEVSVALFIVHGESISSSQLPKQEAPPNFVIGCV